MAEHRGRVVAHLDGLRRVGDLHTLRHGLFAAFLQRAQDLRRVAGQDDVHAPARTPLQRALHDLERRVVAAHRVNDDFHLVSTSSCSVPIFSSERFESSAFLLRLPFTR